MDIETFVQVTLADGRSGKCSFSYTSKVPTGRIDRVFTEASNWIDVEFDDGTTERVRTGAVMSYKILDSD